MTYISHEAEALLDPQDTKHLLAQSEMALRAIERLAGKTSEPAEMYDDLAQEFQDRFQQTYEALTRDRTFLSDEDQNLNLTEHYLHHEEIINQALADLAVELEHQPNDIAKPFFETYQKVVNSGLQDATLAFGTFAVELNREHPELFPEQQKTLDFSRVDALAEPPAVFTQAFESQRDSHKQHTWQQRKEKLSNHYHAQTEYFRLPRHCAEIEGLNFMVHTVDDEEYIVTANGCLAKRASVERIIRDAVRSDRIHDLQVPVFENTPHLSDFITLPDRAIASNPDDLQYPYDSEHKNVLRIYNELLELKNATQVSGTGIAPYVSGFKMVTPICLEQDRLTGLPMHTRGEKKSDLDVFKNYLKEYDGIDKFHQIIPQPETLSEDTLFPFGASQDEQDREFERRRQAIKALLLEKQESILVNIVQTHIDSPPKTVAEMKEVKELFDRSRERLAYMLAVTWKEADREFYTFDEHGAATGIKFPPEEQEQKHFVISQGGMGSGKAGAETLMESLCDNCSFVTGSLDGARSASKVYTLYQANDTHHEDYSQFTELGNAIRDTVVERAKQHGYNLLLDGSGTPYANRYDKTVSEYKEAGYETTLYAADIPLYAYDPEYPNNYYSCALSRVGDRLVAAGRTIPTKIVQQKHIDFPKAFLDAVQDYNLDRIILDDNAGKYGENYPLAWIEDHKGKTPLLAENRHQLEDYFVRSGRSAEQVTERTLELDDGTERILKISNPERYLTMLQKGLMNRESEGPYGLYHNKLLFDAAGTFRGRQFLLDHHPIQGVENIEEPSKWKKMLQRHVRTQSQTDALGGP